MKQEELRTLTLFNTVENTPTINQRQLAQKLDVSLGLANTYFQRVLKKGWIRAKQVEPRRWLYFLTPKGALEKSRLSLSYLHRTLESFRELKKRGDKQLRILYEKGFKGVHLCGENDLIEILSFCFSSYEIELHSVIPEIDLLENQGNHSEIQLPKLKPKEIILIATLDNQKKLIEIINKKGFQEGIHWSLFF